MPSTPLRSPTPPQTPTGSDVGDSHTLDVAEVPATFESDNEWDENEGLHSPINSIHECAVDGEYGQTNVQPGHGGEDITMLLQRLAAVEAVVRAPTEHDTAVLDRSSRQADAASEQTEVLRAQNQLLGDLGTTLVASLDRQVNATTALLEQVRGQNTVLGELSTGVGKLRELWLAVEDERRSQVRHQRQLRKVQCQKLSLIHETLLALIAQLQVSADKNANATSEQTAVMRLLHVTPQQLELPSTSVSPSDNNSPVASPPPRPHGLRMQRGGRKASK